MRFQDYCDSIDDMQIVTAEKALILTYTNSKNEAFTISPESIRRFIKFFVSNYESIYRKWENTPTKKKEIFQYEEKSYREIYKAADIDELKIISSAGKSQTKALTKLITKIIAFLTGQKYTSPEENTFFIQEKFIAALDVWDDENGETLTTITTIAVRPDIEREFREWMLKNGLSERTANSYSVSAIKYCDKYAEQINNKNSTLYNLSSAEVLSALVLLQQVPEWKKADSAGNSMYSAACKKLAKFLSEREEDNEQSVNHISKAFILLAGVSGTGKTRFVRKQAGVNKNLTETYCLTSVRPDWHEPSDLLGYISRLNGDAEYVTTDVLQFIAKAWRGILSSELVADEVEIPDQGKRLAISGEREALRNVLPYWLCLDEMNLAPVEQYFSDYLSVLETREWRWDENRFKYLSDPLLKAATIDQVKDKAALRKGLGFEDVQFDEIWEHFCKHGLGIPFNLIVAGTVNMDETTHGFSRKVIDRALSFDFGAFFPNDFDQFFYPRTVNKTLSYPVLSQADPKCLSDTHDRDGSKSIAFLKVVNGILDNTPFQLAYRALNELLLAVASHNPKDELSLKAVWDDFLMCKVLPRIEGDADKLGSAPSVLELLNIELEKQFSEFWDKQDDEPNARPDLFREATEGEDRVVRVACRSKAKLEWMQVRLVNSSFTSFWP